MVSQTNPSTLWGTFEHILLMHAGKRLKYKQHADGDDGRPELTWSIIAELY
jgi:hypothetical protein